MHKSSLLFAVALAALAFAGPAEAQPTPPGQGQESPSCEDELGPLRIVRPERVRALDKDNKVRIIPICEHETGISILGNASGLHRIIARNKWLMQHLEDEDYAADEVVGIAFGANESVYLYVHHAN